MSRTISIKLSRFSSSDSINMSCPLDTCTGTSTPGEMRPVFLICVAVGGFPGGGTGVNSSETLLPSDHAEGRDKAEFPLPLIVYSSSLTATCTPSDDATCRGHEDVPSRFITICTSRDFKGQVPQDSGTTPSFSRRYCAMTQTSVLRKRRCTCRNVSGLSIMPRSVICDCS